jgi:hypothetical protein
MFPVRYELNFYIPLLYRRNSVSLVEAGSNTFTVALRVVRSDEKGPQCLGVVPGHPVPLGHKYEDLALRFGGVSNLRE